jgi:hypothetical protein
MKLDQHAATRMLVLNYSHGFDLSVAIITAIPTGVGSRNSSNRILGRIQYKAARIKETRVHEVSFINYLSLDCIRSITI